jgi:hypothetical protein
MAMVEFDQARAIVAQESAFQRALEPSSFDSALKAATAVFKSGVGGCKSPEDALMRMATGRELGLGFMTSIRLIYNINGKTGLDASLMLALCLRNPICEDFECVETTDTIATFIAKRRGKKAVKLSFTIEDARRAKLADKDIYKAYPPAMLRARCIAALSRLVFPDIVAGLYTRDELEDGVIDAVGSSMSEMDGEVVESRDYDAECAVLVKSIEAAATKEERAAVRKAVATSDLPEPWLDKAKTAYNTMIANSKKEDAAA